MKPQIFENLETYKDLFDHAHDLIHIVEPDGKILFVNKAWKNVLGYTPEEIEGKLIESFVDPNDRDLFITYRKEIIAGLTENTEVIVKFISSNGNKISLEGFVSVRKFNDKPLYTRGIFRDVTAKLQIEKELREREENLQQLLHHAPDAIIVIDVNSMVTYWNPKAELVFGWNSDEAVGNPLEELIIPVQHRKAHRDGMKRYLATGQARVLNKSIEITALNKERREFYVSLTISSTFQKGEIAFIAFLRDIDEQKRNAIELDLKRAQLEISNAELEQFAHVASHDMKEPIRKIMIFTGKLKDEISHIIPIKSAGFLNKIENASNRLMSMVDGVLSYSMIKANGIEFKKVDLNEVLKNVEYDLELIILEKQAELRYHKLPVVPGAEFLLYQLFYNIINNALKFSKTDETPVLEITHRKLNPDEFINYPLDNNLSYVEITIRDNGIGFDQDHALQIFRTFTRLNSKDQYEGTGLGLSLSKNIVDKHNGFIYATGEINVGASFIIILPINSPTIILSD